MNSTRTCFVTVMGNQGDAPRHEYLRVADLPLFPTKYSMTQVAYKIHEAVWKPDQGQRKTLVVREVVALDPDTWVVILVGGMIGENWVYFVRWHY